MNKIEDLAILTGDQAFCANCFKCRNCKRKIENLRYARTSQGIFCMDCHEALMARRRKKTAKGSSSKKSANIDKSLPAIPPPEARHTQYVPTGEDLPFQEPMPTLHEAPANEVPSVSKTMSELRHDTDSDNSRPPTSQSQPQGMYFLPKACAVLTQKQVVLLCLQRHIETTEGPSLLVGPTCHLEAKSSSYHSHSIPILSKFQRHQINRIHSKLDQTKKRQETSLLRMSCMVKVAPYHNLRVLKLRKTSLGQSGTTICAHYQMLPLADQYRHLRRSYNRNSHSHLRRHICRDMSPRQVTILDCRMLLKTERRLQVVPRPEPTLPQVLLNSEVHS